MITPNFLIPTAVIGGMIGLIAGYFLGRADGIRIEQLRRALADREAWRERVRSKGDR